MYESHKLSCFLSGLKNELRLPMRMLGPKNLNKEFPKYKKNIYGVSGLISGLGMKVSNPLFWELLRLTSSLLIKLESRLRVPL